MRTTTSPGVPEGQVPLPTLNPTKDRIRAVLSHRHDGIEQQLKSIMTGAACGDPMALRERWRVFEAELLSHFHTEERDVFSIFARQRPGEAHALLDEHEQIRARLTELGIDLDLHFLPAERIASFVDSLRAHVRHEDELLYPWAAGWIDGAGRDHVIGMPPNAEETTMNNRDEWQIDGDHSTLGFSLRHIVIHEIRGQFARWGGTVTLDDGDLVKSSVRIWIDLASVDTGDGERDDQIRSPEFFDVERFPQATFASTAIRLREHGNPIVKGRLDLHGGVRDIEVEITNHNRWTDDRGVERASYAIKAKLDRRTFGLRWNQDLDVGGVVVGDEIEVVARFEAVRGQAAP